MKHLGPVVYAWLATWVVITGLAVVVLVVLQLFGALTPVIAQAVMALSAAVGIATGIALAYLHVGAVRPRGRDGEGIFRYVVLGLVPTIVLAVGVWLATAATEPQVSIAILLITGVVALLLMLAVTAVFFHGLALNDKGEALGLPRGSIRAVIALALIVVFAIMSVFLFNAIDAAEAREQMALQLITALTTLVVAIASFYFGSNAVQTATESVIATRSVRSLRLTGVPDPPQIVRKSDGWQPESIEVTARAHPPGAKVEGQVYGDSAGSLTEDAGKFVYKPNQPDDRVLLLFRLADDHSVSQQAELQMIDENAPQPPPAGEPPQPPPAGEPPAPPAGEPPAPPAGEPPQPPPAGEPEEAGEPGEPPEQPPARRRRSGQARPVTLRGSTEMEPPFSR